MVRDFVRADQLVVLSRTNFTGSFVAVIRMREALSIVLCPLIIAFDIHFTTHIVGELLDQFASFSPQFSLHLLADLVITAIEPSDIEISKTAATNATFLLDSLKSGDCCSTA
jgi:hypothetical protein